MTNSATTTLSSSRDDCLEIMGAQTFRSPQGLARAT